MPRNWLLQECEARKMPTRLAKTLAEMSVSGRGSILHTCNGVNRDRYHFSFAGIARKSAKILLISSTVSTLSFAAFNVADIACKT
jgi:hypothetical protein